ncbi:MAG: hypothetical protein JRJ27_12115 [Deltaproteobacteria bacterium]|nr:hypothetical protein [Deltaproteobacteria bacterium]
MKKGFGKPSTWKQGTKEVANEMIAEKVGQEAYEKAVLNATQKKFAVAFEQALKKILKNN